MHTRYNFPVTFEYVFLQTTVFRVFAKTFEGFVQIWIMNCKTKSVKTSTTFRDKNLSNLNIPVFRYQPFLHQACFHTIYQLYISWNSPSISIIDLIQFKTLQPAGHFRLTNSPNKRRECQRCVIFARYNYWFHVSNRFLLISHLEETSFIITTK
jgi:hypothetical protein